MSQSNLSRQIKDLIRRYGGNETLKNIIIIENPTAFDYFTYNEAKKDENALKISKKIKLDEMTASPAIWGIDNYKIFHGNPDWLKNQPISRHMKRYRKLQLLKRTA